MVKLALTVVPIALPDCINPTLIGGELFVATGAHPRRRTAVFTLAALTVTFLFGLAFALGLGDLILSLVPRPGATVKYALIIVAGLTLTLGGIGVFIRRRSLAKAERPRDQPRQQGPAGLLGAGIGGLELLTAFPYFAAVFAVMGDRADGVLLPFGDWLFVHWPVIVGPLTAVIGLGVLTFGIVELIST